MATVYRTFDVLTNKRVALKMLKQAASESLHVSALFEREFYTLAQLAHPRIIEVYDYGVYERRAFYTMELLDGEDLQSLAPLGWKNACGLLRDVASSLALLHSRRLLHRDISSRNVRRTAEGRAKLIDFGAMAPFGPPTRVIGTPAFIAPETINQESLDQRTDLYALGVLAYWLITKRHAYRAHRLSELHDAWRISPPPLSALASEIPKALNDLVMSLLSLDRIGRPAFASEVVETLGACAGLAPDDTLAVKQAYLTTPQLVGRKAAVTLLHQRVLAMWEGKGGETLLIEGPSGIGRSRLLAEAILVSKAIGATVLSSGVEFGERRLYGVAWKLLEQLLMHVYDLAAEAIKPHVTLLKGVFPDLDQLMRSRSASRTQIPVNLESLSAEWGSTEVNLSHEEQETAYSRPSMRISEYAGAQGRARGSVQKALLDIFMEIARQRRLVIAVDDIHRADEPSAALLATLTLLSEEKNIVVVLTAESGATPSAPAAYSLFSRVARRVELGPLDLTESENLLGLIFGETPNVALLANRIYAISKGNPRAVMQLAQHLVDRGLVRYQSGAWSLPVSIDPRDLPSSMNETLNAEVQALSAQARELAQTIALSVDQRFSFDECLRLAGQCPTAELTLKLNELIGRNVLTGDGTYYTLSQTGWIRPLIEGMDQASEQAAHLRLAQTFEQSGDQRFRMGQHLLRAGQTERALDVFLDLFPTIRKDLSQDTEAYAEYIQSLPPNWYQTLEELLAVCKTLGRTRMQRHHLLSTIVGLGAVEGSVRRDYVIELIEQLLQDSGLAVYRDLGDSVDPSQRLWRALELTQARYDQSPEAERVLSPTEAIPELAETILLAISIASTSFDYALLESLPSLTPLVPLSQALGVVESNVWSTRQVIGGDPERARQGYLKVLERLAQPDHGGIEESYYEYAYLTVTQVVGLIEASLGMKSDLSRLESLEARPLFQVNNQRIRMIYYLRRGEVEKAEQCNRYREMLQIQNNPSQFFNGGTLLPELLAHGFSDDRTKVRQTLESIKKMAERFRGWVPIYHYGQSEYQRLCGAYTEALSEAEKALALVAPTRHAIWPYAVAAQLRNLLELGRAQQASSLGYAYLESAKHHGYSYMLNHIALPLALVEARLNHAAAAIELADNAIEAWKGLGVMGITLGYAYEIRARVAIYTADPMSFKSASQLCAEQYRVGFNPALTAKYQKLIQDADYWNAAAPVAGIPSSELVQPHDGSAEELVASVRDCFVQCKGLEHQLQVAIELIVKEVGCRDGFLYLLEEGEPVLVAQTTEALPPEGTLQAIEEFFPRVDREGIPIELSEINTATASGQDVGPLFETVVLSASVDGRELPMAVAILLCSSTSDNAPLRAVCQAVARCLYETSRK